MRLVVEVASYILNIRRAVYTVGYGHLVLTGKLISYNNICDAGKIRYHKTTQMGCMKTNWVLLKLAGWVILGFFTKFLSS